MEAHLKTIKSGISGLSSVDLPAFFVTLSANQNITLKIGIKAPRT
jgi:hypothetical protein